MGKAGATKFSYPTKIVEVGVSLHGKQADVQAFAKQLKAASALKPFELVVDEFAASGRRIIHGRLRICAQDHLHDKDFVNIGVQDVEGRKRCDVEIAAIYQVLAVAGCKFERKLDKASLDEYIDENNKLIATFEWDFKK